MVDVDHAALDELLWQIAQQRVKTPFSQAELIAAIQAMSQQYQRTGRTQGAVKSLALNLAARLLFFTPADAPKMAYVASELIAQDRLGQDAIRVLDLGAGCGAQALGLISALATRQAGTKLVVTLCDIDSDALGLAQMAVTAWAAHYGDRLSVTKVETSVKQLETARFYTASYDLILMGSVLCELSAEMALTLVRRAMQWLAPGGYLLIVEPALKQTSRALHQLRGELITNGVAAVVAPCTHQNDCPMLASAGDWCHEQRLWSVPPKLKHLFEGTGLRRDLLLWSYLTLTQPNTLHSQACTTMSRVVSNPLPSKGKLEYFVCDHVGRRRLTRLNRHSSDMNVAFEQLQRGYRVHWSQPERETSQDIRIGSQTHVVACDVSNSLNSTSGRLCPTETALQTDAESLPVNKIVC